MQQSKSTKQFTEIAAYCENETSLPRLFSDLMKWFDLSYINRILSKTKKRGFDAKKVFQVLFTMRFLDFDNVHQLMQAGISKELAHKKDVLYDFLKNPRIDWAKIVLLFAKQVLRIIDVKSIDKEPQTPKFLIVDDSILHKTGKKIEAIGTVFNHGTRLHPIGMKMLTLGYHDGKNFFPLDFSLHHEPGKNGNRGLKKKELKAQYSKDRPADSPGAKRLEQVGQSKTSTASEMIAQILMQKKAFPVDYVLADSWFISHDFIASILDNRKDVNVIGLMKTNRKVNLDDKIFIANKIPEIKRKLIKGSTKFKCRYIQLNFVYQDIEMRGYWIQMNGQNTWKLLVTTDRKLSFLNAMRYYQTRWSIEVFFKDCKQNLGLNDCHSTDFDAHIANTSIVFMNYMVLALKKRFEDYESIGGLFRELKSAMIELTLVAKIWKLLMHVFIPILADFGLDWEEFTRKTIQDTERVLALPEKLNHAWEAM